ncbi:SAR2788 family putative toxin [Exiguobacterium sp. R-17]|uniref:SAR2788 family putative toxin n=1 Tax=Exiguobacterium sp. R-17 TaxID=3404054 RepID=UPI003CF0BB5D
MKKMFILLITVTYMLSYILPANVIAEESNVIASNELSDLTTTETIEPLNNNSNTNNIVVEDYTKNQTGYIDTSIDNQGLTVESQLELDFETNHMTVDAVIADAEGNLVNKSFDVAIEKVNNEEDFSAILTDSETLSTYKIDSSEASASWYPLVVIAINVARFGVQQAIKKYGKTAVKKATGKYGKKATAKTLKKVKFQNKSLFNGHWNKHKHEFPGYTQSKYLARAQTLVNAKGKHILTKKRSNGDILRYNKDTNELLILNKNDVIKTLFKPRHPNKKSGYEYFKDQ